MNVAVVVQGFAAIAWVIVILGVVLIVTRVSRGRNPQPGIVTVLVGVLLALVLTTVSAGLVFIPPDQRGVVISAVAPKGYREEALQPGLRWIVPFLENVESYSISKMTYTMSITQMEGAVIGDDSITARTQDGQEILIDSSVIFSVDPNKTIKVHIEWQKRYINDLVRPLARGVIRDAVSQYGVEEVVSGQRDIMSQEIKEVMRVKLEENGLLLADFVLRNITFSSEYAASVEQKQIAEQLALQARLIVEQKRQEAEQARQTAQGVADAAVIEAQGRADSRLIEAEAEAKALELIAAAIQENPAILQYQYINQLAPGIRVMLVPNNAPYLLPLPSLEDESGQTVVVTPSAQSAPQPPSESEGESSGESSTAP
jgi:regulator of protease activity HflC (stomatin/prohibitin superfamily)